jgi:hypothetical protein
MSDHTMCPGCHQLRYWTDFDARCSQCRHPTPSSGEEMESSPPKLPFWWAPWKQWRKDVNEMLEQLQRRMNEVEQRAHSGMCRIQRLEAGPRSPPTSAKPTTHSHLDAEPCLICHLPQKSGPHRHPMAPAPEPDSLSPNTGGPCLQDVGGMWMMPCPSCGQELLLTLTVSPKGLSVETRRTVPRETPTS